MSSVRLLSFLLVVLATTLGSCASQEEPPVAFSAAWLTPTGVIPDSVASLRVVRVLGPTTQVDLFERTVGSLTDDDDNGRRELRIDGLAVGETVDLELQGLGEDGLPIFIGRSGHIFLTHGERRYIDVAMYPIGQTAVDRFDPLPPRMMHTATTLLDGRVLISGGYTTVGDTPCPAGSPAETSCFALTASGDAWVYDPTTARFHAITGGTLVPRGGHSATLLDDGRVLVAGGAPSAVLAITRVGDFGDARELAIFPDMTHGSFELFEPSANAEAADTERNGDPAAGGFVGGDGGSTPGSLNSPRFMHAAALMPHNGDQVLLAGGMGGASSYEIFDARKPGGPGVYASTTNTLDTPRPFPSAIGLGGSDTPQVWIFGGGVATANANLADLWVPSDTDPNGSAGPADAVTVFPNPDMRTDEHPEFSLIKPALASFEDGAFALVTGWYGPRCPPNMFAAAPIFDMGSTSICGHSGGADRSFTIANADGTTIRTQPPSGARHAFAETVTLTDGKVLIIGGVQDQIFTGIRQTVIYQNIMSGAARGTAGASLTEPRLFHGAARIFDSGVLVVGGASIESSGTGINLVNNSEAIMLAPPRREAPTGGGE